MKLALFLLMSLTVFVAGKAHAQMVNMQGVLSSPIYKGWSLTGEINQSQATGNKRLQTFAASGTVSFKRPHYLLLLTSSRYYSSNFGEATTDSYFDHAHGIYRFTRNFGWEAFNQDDSDRFRRSQRRNTVGTGPRLQFLPMDRLSLAVSTDFVSEHEVFSPRVIYYYQRPQPDDGTYEDLILPPEPDRWTNRISTMFYWNWRWGRYSSLGNTTYFEPAIKDIGNRKVLNEASFLLGLNDIFSFRFSHTMGINSRPPEGVEKVDRYFSQSWMVEFYYDGSSKPSEDQNSKTPSLGPT